MLKMTIKRWIDYHESLPIGTYQTTVLLYGLDTIAFTFNGHLTRKRCVELIWRQVVNEPHRSPAFLTALRNVK